MQPPAQELTARDLHNHTWTFRHIYRGISTTMLCLSFIVNNCIIELNKLSKISFMLNARAAEEAPIDIRVECVCEL